MEANQPIAERLAHAVKHAAEQASLRRIAPRVGDVYFIQCNEFVKIGFAYDVPSRVCNLQTGNPYKLTLLKVIPSMTPEQLEQDLHAHVEQFRVRGEWFKLPPDVLAAVLED